MNAGELLKQLISQFDNDSTEPYRDAQMILAHTLGHPRTWLLAHLDTPLTPPQIDSAPSRATRASARCSHRAHRAGSSCASA